MGAPKQKWTSEEEAALKAGIHKYGLGKWSTILKDPEFSTVLRSRSNVDLKDKWRNLNCMASGSGSRTKSRVATQNNASTVRTLVLKKDPEVHSITPISASSEISHDAGSIEQISRVDDLVLEAIRKLKEPRGSSRSTIAEYIEDHYSAPPDLERSLAASLKILTEKGRLIKVKHQYRIAPRSMSSDAGKDPALLLVNGEKKDPSESERKVVKLLTKAQIDAELEKMMSMNAEDAAAAAAKAVAEAEAAIAEAEAAAREAEEAEAEAEEARCFADAASKSINYQTTIRV
ncbi:hypothetical protein RD792_001398 [Penstemon davidsonii]|uniref:MYB transcription factor n=1 Tax=Penstemon davidsonii TaxID=160366 RepID=A0ABR0DNC0_9LAMI|nr:hypothetical protein RD792_001398 [Penstemon davidsonii]